jgi:hypothetical protein
LKITPRKAILRLASFYRQGRLLSVTCPQDRNWIGSQILIALQILIAWQKMPQGGGGCERIHFLRPRGDHHEIFKVLDGHREPGIGNRFQGRNYGLTDVAGEVVREILA